MIRHRVFLPCTICVALYHAHLATAATLFDDDFDDGQASTRFSAPFFSAETGSIDGLVDYALDYSTLGLPSAPHSSGGSTIGLGIQVNNTDDPVDEGEAIGVSPNVAALPGDYSVSVDAYIYYGGGAGSSEHAVLGVDADGTAVPFTFVTPGAGQFYHIPHNSGVGTPSYPDDYYLAADGVLIELYDGDGAADSDSVPDAETIGIFPADGTDPIFNDAGFPGNQWMTLKLEKSGNMLSMSINGTLIDTHDIGSGASTGDIVLAGADIFNSANPDNWIIFDNIAVVPEPATWVLLVMAGLGFGGRIRNSKA